MTEPPLNLCLVDEDPVFRLGLRVWLDQRPEFHVLGEAATAEVTLHQLTEWQTSAINSSVDAGADAPSPTVDVVILDLGLGQGDPDQLPGLQLCGEIKRQFPQVSVLVLSAQGEPVLEAAAKHMGADGFGLRGLPVRDLARLIQRVAQTRANLASPEAEVSLPPQVEGPITYLHKSSLLQIDAAIADIEQQATQRLPYWYRLVLAGKYRELRAARWLIQQILPLSDENIFNQGSKPFVTPTASSAEKKSASFITQLGNQRMTSQRVASRGGAIIPISPTLPIVIGDVRSRVCEAVFRKLQFPFENRSDIPLELDILRADKARELLYTLLRSFESLLDDLQQAQVPPGQLVARSPAFLHDLWEAVIVDFFGRYYTPPIDGLEQPMVVVLQQDTAVIQAAILNRIPEVPTLLAHLLFETPLEIDGASYIATTPEALRRSQFLLENLLIQTGCAVLQPVLNRFADVESLKRNLYQRNVISTRDITRFRNDLSWRYRWDALVYEPKTIFESQHRLFVFTPQGIQTHRIYAPRQAELASLSGVPYIVTLALEARDALSPRVRAALSFVGSGVIFVLTEVIGRGIGLVGRGIFKGVGSAWRDSRLRQRQHDEM